MSAVYQHPDGHAINIARCVMTMTNDADESVSVPIGQLGLRELGERMIALSESEFTAADCSEQAGKGRSTMARLDALALRLLHLVPYAYAVGLGMMLQQFFGSAQ